MNLMRRGEMKNCEECRGAGFWWKQTAELEVGARFSEPEKIICPKCNGTGKIEDTPPHKEAGE
jgi:DnaJ-class molecular chaperone